MIWSNRNKTSLLLLSLVWVLACAKKEANTPVAETVETPSQYYSTQHLIGVAGLMIRMNDEDIKIIDIRKPAQYKKGHIPNAINIWRPMIANDSFPYGGMMIKKQDLAFVLGELGIGSDKELILYDNKGACDAARLWWILKQYGFENTRLLNGGWKSWQLENGESSTSDVVFAKADFNFLGDSPMNEYASISDMKIAVLSEQPSVVALDTRSSAEYAGKVQKKGASAAGRIPSSINIDWAKAIDYHSTMQFKSADELALLYPAHQFGHDNRVRVYCHSGVRSAHTTFVLTQLLGYKNVRNFDGSWTEWSYHTDLPYDKDSLNTVL